MADKWPKTLYPHAGGREWSTEMFDEWKRDLAVEVVPVKQLEYLRWLLLNFVEYEGDPCSFDHNGFCQEHGWFGDNPGDCNVRWAREELGLDA